MSIKLKNVIKWSIIFICILSVILNLIFLISGQLISIVTLKESFKVLISISPLISSLLLFFNFKLQTKVAKRQQIEHERSTSKFHQSEYFYKVDFYITTLKELLERDGMYCMKIKGYNGAGIPTVDGFKVSNFYNYSSIYAELFRHKQFNRDMKLISFNNFSDLEKMIPCDYAKSNKERLDSILNIYASLVAELHNNDGIHDDVKLLAIIKASKVFTPDSFKVLKELGLITAETGMKIQDFVNLYSDNIN